METPSMGSRGFMLMPLSAQALWFHLSARADAENRLSAWQAKQIREDIGATQDDVRMLMQNRYITSEEEGARIRVEDRATYWGMVDGQAGREVIHSYFHRQEIWRESLAEYEKRERERRTR